MDPEERILARSGSSWKAVVVLPFLGGLLFMASRVPLWMRWAFLATTIVFALWFVVCQVVIRSASLQRRYPFRLIFRNGRRISAGAITQMTCSYVPSTVHAVVVDAMVEGKKHSFSVEVGAYEVRCFLFDFAIRHDIPLTCRSDKDKMLVEQIRTGVCHRDPATGIWNVPGVD